LHFQVFVSDFGYQNVHYLLFAEKSKLGYIRGVASGATLFLKRKGTNYDEQR